MMHILPLLLSLLHWGHLAAVRPQGVPQEEHPTIQTASGGLGHASQRAAGATETLSVGHSAALRRDHGRKRLQHSSPLVSAGSALADLSGNSSEHPAVSARAKAIDVAVSKTHNVGPDENAKEAAAAEVAELKTELANAEVKEKQEENASPVPEADRPSEHEAEQVYDVRAGVNIVDTWMRVLFDVFLQPGHSVILTSEWTKFVKGPWADVMWHVIDQNNDHEINFGEFDSGWDPAVTAAFKVMGGFDGKIEEEKVDAWEVPPDEKAFAKTLVGQDGVMDRSEFEEFIYTVMLFCAIDTNHGDGKARDMTISYDDAVKFGMVLDALGLDKDFHKHFADGMKLDGLFKFLDDKAVFSAPEEEVGKAAAAQPPPTIELPDNAMPEEGPISGLIGETEKGETIDQYEATQEMDDAIVDIQEVERIWGRVQHKIATFYEEEDHKAICVKIVFYFAAVFIAMGLYVTWFQHREIPKEQDFRYGLFGCLGDSRICLSGMLCPAVRWADTVSEEKGGFYGFTSAFCLMVGLGFLVLCPYVGTFAWFVLISVGVYYRQSIREKYGLENGTWQSYIEDCWIWCCCSCCAICQEARQVDDEPGKSQAEDVPDGEKTQHL